MIKTDTKVDIADEILTNVLNINYQKCKRFTNGYCHSVYYIECDNDKYVLRVTGRENEEYYHGSVKWLTELNVIGVSVPIIHKHGEYKNVFYALLSYINGTDLGEVYHELNDIQKREIARNLVSIQRKVSALPSTSLYGYNSHQAWNEYLESLINRSYKRIMQNSIFDINVCNEVREKMKEFDEYFLQIKPVPFLDDITTKNVLICDGKLSGIVDVDEICYGDPLMVIGLTNMALLSMREDTDYIDYWLDEINASNEQRKAVKFYTLLFCVDFMGEQGTKFNNDTEVFINKQKNELLSSIYMDLLAVL